MSRLLKTLLMELPGKRVQRAMHMKLTHYMYALLYSHTGGSLKVKDCLIPRYPVSNA